MKTERMQRHRETSRLWRAKNLERAKANWKRWYQENRETVLAQDRKEYWAHPEKSRNRVKQWIAEHPDQAREKNKRWIAAHREWVAERFRIWCRIHPEKVREYGRKRWSTVEGKIEKALRRRLSDALKGKSKSIKTMVLLGCSIDFLRQHLESQFRHEMTWENYGRKAGREGWVIDHIRPCASFDLTDLEQQKKCFHWSNLQPLWDHENAEKHASIGGKSIGC